MRGIVEAPLQRERRARAGRVGTGLLVASWLVFHAACDGSNMFSDEPPVPDMEPPVVQINEPVDSTASAIGDSVFVSVDIGDDIGVVSLELTGVFFDGDPALGTEQTIPIFQPKVVNFGEGVADTTVLRYLLSTGDTRSAPVSLIATARDAAGNIGADTVEIFVGGPRVRILSPQDGGAAVRGKPLHVRVTAADEGGIAALRLNATGVIDSTLTLCCATPSDSVMEVVELALPANREGELRLQAEAVGVAGGLVRRSPPVTINIQSGGVADTLKPFVRFNVEAADRMELTDRVQIQVSARDDDTGSGIMRMGYTVLAINNATVDTVVMVQDTTFGSAVTGAPDFARPFEPFNVDMYALPDSVTFVLYAFAVDSAGNCAAAVATNLEQQLECQVSGNVITAAEPGTRVNTVVVSGRTVKLPDGGVIADAVVDTARKRLYLSNFSYNKIDVLDLATYSFVSAAGIAVGAQPWGLFLNAAEDTLLVANSGGTNISYVSLADMEEDASRRLSTPNVALFQIPISIDGTTGHEKYTGWEYFDLSDRPQFVAIDSTGTLLYSTVPTAAARPGTIRYADMDPVPGSNEDRPEVRLLFTEAKAVLPAENSYVIAHVDSLKVYKVDHADDAVEIWDHVPGFAHDPDSVIYSGMTTIATAVNNLRAQGSDVFARRGTWNIEGLSMSDTTFLAASGDRGWVAFGEGATAPTGRIIMWNAATRSISNDISVDDLINNASERVLGLGLNHNGSLGVARGQQAAYFFTPDLRLQGVFEDGGGAGAAMHPSHDKALGSDATTLSFIGTGENTVRIVDTFHFRKRGEIEIRDNIVGPLKSALPFASDNQGLACPGSPECVVVKLYGITDSGGVVILDVREKDIQPN